MAFFKFKPAIRLVNASGAVTAGPLKLWMPDSLNQGIYLESSVPRYAREEIVYMNLAYSTRKRFLGYRPEVDLAFGAVLADGASGMALLDSYFSAAVVSDTFAALQFNAFAESCNVWRGMFPTSDWAPQLLGGKQRAGYALTISLQARDLIPTKGDWSAGVW